jgi:hypothetical protein
MVRTLVGAESIVSTCCKGSAGYIKPKCMSFQGSATDTSILLLLLLLLVFFWVLKVQIASEKSDQENNLVRNF